MHIIAGVDLAWMGTRNPTAIAVGHVTHGVVELASIIESRYGTQSVIDALDGVPNLHGVAIDGPLIITNQTGQRECERLIGVAYGARKASCHTSNLGKFPDAAGVQVSSHLSRNGFRHVGHLDEKWQLECYPHPALIEIFGLPERLPYKKGAAPQKRDGQTTLGEMILSLERSNILRLRVADAFRPYFDADRIRTLRGAQLKHNEDVLDAVVCMYIGALYQSGQEQTVFGTTSDGYIYVPTSRIPHGKPPIPHAGGGVAALTISDACGTEPGGSGTRLGKSDMTTTAERRKRVVSLLGKHKQRATYGAVGGLLDRLARSVMAGQRKCWENSWVVSARTGLPTGYDEDEIDPDLEVNPEVIDTWERLAEWLDEIE